MNISFALSASDKPKAQLPPVPKPQNGVKRPHAALDHDSDEEDVSTKGQSITHFDVSAGGAIDARKPKVEKKPLIIEAQANRDWKEAAKAAKRQKYGMVDEKQKSGVEEEIRKKEAQKPTYGLVVHEAQAEGEGANGDAAPAEEKPPAMEQEAEESALVKPKTVDERALDALLGKEQKSELVLPMSEEEAFERDYHEAPDMPTLEQYAAVPVEEFGAALLRGMGWKEGQGIGSQKNQRVKAEKAPERRPALLGIGAKADAAVAAELGAWGRGAGGRKKTDVVYNPLTLKNKRTGEVMTEEEMKRRLDDQKERDSNPRDPDRDYDRKDRSSRRHRYDDEEDERGYDRKRIERRKEIEYDQRDSNRDHDRKKSDKRRERNYDDDRHRSSRRNRSASTDRNGRSRRDDDDYEDRRDKDRRRRDRDDYDRGHGKRDCYEDDRDRDSRRHRR
ncbi:DNA primase large subunit Spp2 [Taxawa tesnikishii (nom. ined.)]|nr:DNA primase large subunit Spp2 [Dothideales sp. JES 119]